jgi:hypothetical protein
MPPKRRRYWLAILLTMAGITVIAILVLPRMLSDRAGLPEPKGAGPTSEESVGALPAGPPSQRASPSPAPSAKPAIPSEEPPPKEPGTAKTSTAKAARREAARVSPAPAKAAMAEAARTASAPTEETSSLDISETQVQNEYQNAVERAKSGKIDYQVPNPMSVGNAQSVIVRIYGPNASQQQQAAFPSTGRGTLKVVTSMVVALTEPDNPSAFEIKAEDDSHQGIQFVPVDGYAEWDWVVTPLEGGTEPRKLHITADMVFDAKLPNGTPVRTEIASYDAAVQVRVKPRLEAFADWWSENWKDILKYLIPTGSGSLLVIWLLSRGWKKKAKPRRDQESSTTPNTESVENDDDDGDD